MFRFFNKKSIEQGNVFMAPRGFRYGYFENILQEEAYENLINSLPSVNTFSFVDKANSGGGRKRFYVGPNYYSGQSYGCYCHMKKLPKIWVDFMEETESPEFQILLSEKTKVLFNSLCNFGFTYGNEGCMQEPHIDGAARSGDTSPIHATIACLLYFNKERGGSSGTCIYEPDRKTKLFQVPNLRNSMSFFEQHPDSWHGFPKVPEGETRRLISLSYSLEKSPLLLKKSRAHEFFCPAEKVFRKITRKI